MTFPVPQLTVAAADTGLVGGLTGLADTIVAARRWLSDRHNWVRIGWFGAGYVMILAGAYVLARPAIDAGTKAAAPAVSGAANIAKAALI